MNSNKMISVIAVALMILTTLSVFSDSSESASSSNVMLIDMGDGRVSYGVISTSGTVETVSKKVLNTMGRTSGDFSNGSLISLDKISNSASCKWRFYQYVDSDWIETDVNSSTQCPGGSVAWGFYPQGLKPVATPDLKDPWAMIGGTSAGSSSQTTSGPGLCGVEWYAQYEKEYLNARIMVAGDKVFFTSGGVNGKGDPSVHCRDRLTGELIWEKTYAKGLGWEIMSMVVLSDRLVIPTSSGYILFLDPETGTNVIEPVKFERNAPDGIYKKFSSGPSTIIYDSGYLYFGSSDGKFYKTDVNGNIVGSVQMNGGTYYTAPVILTDSQGKKTAFIGCFGGTVYAVDCDTMQTKWSKQLIDRTGQGSLFPGTIGGITILDESRIFVFYNDGDMSPGYAGLAAFDLTKEIKNGILEPIWTKDQNELGLMGSPGVVVDGHMIFSVSGSAVKIDWNGNILWKEKIGTMKGAPVLSGGLVYFSIYDAPGYVVSVDPNSGKVVHKYDMKPATDTGYTMMGVTIADGKIYVGSDDGIIYCYGMGADPPVKPTSGGIDPGLLSIIILILIVAAMIGGLVWFYVTRVSKDSSKSITEKRKIKLVMVISGGAVLAIAVFLLSLSLGTGGNMSVFDALGNLVSALGKGGQNLTIEESYIYYSRLPRAIAAFAVGIGLSVAGSMYQAVIRNPLVDPYITGVSAGAGLAAIIAIVFGTALGMTAGMSLIVTPIAAMIGGLVAFGATMLIAEKAGGSSINYVLGGVIIGLAFSSIQTIILSMAGDQLHDAMFWLFGSFANVTWNNVWLIVVPAIGLSFLPLIWAREFNLVLLGEDQAKQMGLNVKAFNRWMMILASILTAICVAFVGIIGFVGLVIPHLCRMILGGDHRLVIPASIVLGGVLLLLADVFARMAFAPYELPIGAITAIIGTPIFAYLLIKKGRIYDG